MKLRPAVFLVCMIGGLFLVPAVPAFGDPGQSMDEGGSVATVDDGSGASIGTNQLGFDVAMKKVESLERPKSDSSKPKVLWTRFPDAQRGAALAMLGSGECTDFFVRADDPEQPRMLDTCPEAGTVSTAQVIRKAFEELTIPTSQIVVQPPGGLTLVNMETLFRTEAESYDETVTLLGHQVTLRIRPVQFVWLPGDGETFTTATPGIAFEKGRPMTDYVSHTYLEPAETVHPSVNVVWSAQYSIDGADWRDVAGTVTTTGPPADLQIKEAVPVLTSGG